ncbi:RICIN domain-containing protein [Kitasatospora sp. NPDC048239]|uniref:RICIN domain-containing protein n=1 Tax=Kitasatospora sp. NPDC048239 TaxID=3364046 RepID=UPI00371A6576
MARHSGKCLDIDRNSAVDGTPAQQHTCNQGLNQQWRLQDAGDGYVRLVARHSGKCLDVANASAADGARLIQWPCGTGANQQFRRLVV